MKAEPRMMDQMVESKERREELRQALGSRKELLDGWATTAEMVG